jgi:RimJ/RimL family protein N-acetyltransferase
MRRTILTERLILRPLELGDAPRVAKLTSEPDVARMVAMIPIPHLPICAEGWILIMRARAPLGLDYVYAVELPGEGLIGCVGAHARPSRDAAAFGYWIGQPYWGRGFATEAAGAAAREARSFGSVMAWWFLDNPASGRVLEKIGFADSGRTEPVFSLARGASAPARVTELAALRHAVGAN